jgi:rhodanese-related sulfurtransferase
MAENILTGLTRTVQWDEVDALMAEGLPLVDVRTPREFADGHIPGSMNIPIDDIRDRIDEVPSPCMVTCRVGQRGHTATTLLRELGIDAVNLDGGFETWSHSPANPLTKE